MEIEDTCGASLIVEDTGTVNVYAPTQVRAERLGRPQQLPALATTHAYCHFNTPHQRPTQTRQMRYQHALAAVQEVEGRNVVAGEVYRVRVLKVVDFGAYVALPNGLPALLHISELSHEKIREVRDVVAEGQEFDVLCKGRDAKGFVQLSLKDLLPKPAKEGEEGEEGGEGGGPSTAGGGSLREAAAAAAAAAAAIREQQQQVEEQQSGRPLQHHVHHQSTGGPAAGHRGGSSTGSSSSRTPRAHVWRRSDNNQQGEE
jgi:predicted RNA-binding protein with RPS1 domain